MNTITAIHKRYGIKLALVISVLSFNLISTHVSVKDNQAQPAVHNQNSNFARVKNKKALTRKEFETQLRVALKKSKKI